MRTLLRVGNILLLREKFWCADRRRISARMSGSVAGRFVCSKDIGHLIRWQDGFGLGSFCRVQGEITRDGGEWGLERERWARRRVRKGGGVAAEAQGRR